MSDDIKKLINESLKAIEKEENINKPESNQSTKIKKNTSSVGDKWSAYKIISIIFGAFLILYSLVGTRWYQNWATKTFTANITSEDSNKAYQSRDVEAWVMSEFYVKAA